MPINVTIHPSKNKYSITDIKRSIESKDGIRKVQSADKSLRKEVSFGKEIIDREKEREVNNKNYPYNSLKKSTQIPGRYHLTDRQDYP